MKVIQKSFELSKIDYYKFHFRLVDAIFSAGMTDKEMDILSCFLSLPESVTKINLFNSEARKEVSEILGMSDSGISNHLKNMKAKGFLKREADILVVIPGLLPAENMQGYNFKIKMKDES